MTFNDNITLDTSGSRSGGRRGAAVGGGISGIGIIGAILYFVLTGQAPDISMITGDASYNASSVETSGFDIHAECKTGADANTKDECRMIAGKNSLDTWWGEEFPAETGQQYAPAGLVMYSGSTQTACGTGTSAMGPFYCPGDNTIYIDVTFYDQLPAMGAQDTSLAQLYILAHEYGHHIQNGLGVLSQMDHQDLGENGDAVRSELQADCLAGVWINHASRTIDQDTGVAFMQEPTQEQLLSAIEAARVVGDDTIYERAGMEANPENFSHGSSESRMKWLNKGITGGTIGSCDTWNVSQP